MLTEETDQVFSTLRKRLEEGLTEADYTGPMKAEELGLPDDLLNSLIELVFETLSGCLGRMKDPAKVADRVRKMNVLQQMFLNTKIRKTIFKDDAGRYVAAGGRKLSDALVYALKRTEESELVSMAEYVRDGLVGLTVYPDL